MGAYPLPLSVHHLPLGVQHVVRRGRPGFEYERIEGVEWLERYRPDGYHPILIGDVLHDRYRVIHKLGHGTFATIWLARDQRKSAYVAVKVGTAESQNREADNLRAIADSTASSAGPRGRSMIFTLHDEFEIQGPNGRHRCLVTVPARSSVSVASFSRLFKRVTARALAAQLVLAVAYTHGRGFIHGDIHLGNVIIRLPSNFNLLSIYQLYETFGEPHMEPVVRLDRKPLPSGVPSHGVVPVWLGKKANEIGLAEARILLSDFGESFSPSREKRTRNECHAPLPVMPPEAYFEPDEALSFPSDMWTLACAIWSILTPRALFDATLATAHDIALQQVDKVGPLPFDWWNRWEERHEYFNEAGPPREGRHIYAPLARSFETDVQKYRRRDEVGEFCQDETAAILEMLRSMLKFTPEDRATAEQVLKSDWMVKWALPEFEKVPSGI